MRQAPDPGLQFSREQMLLTPEGRRIQRQWVYADSEPAGVRVNIVRGLTLFTNRDTDLSTFYVNPGAGFFDPLTGALVWLGIPLLLWRLRRADPNDPRALMDRFAAVALLSLWMAMTFVVNKMPNFTRLLVLLPLAAYAALEALDALGRRASDWTTPRGRRPWPIREAVVGLGLLAILGSNARLYAAYAVRGLAQGETVGSTARFITARAHQPRHWILVADADCPYYWSPEPAYWKDWIGWFTTPEQSVDIYAPQAIGEVTLQPPFTVFLSDGCWARLRHPLQAAYPTLQVHPLTADGSRLALSVD
jgi:hypothetical protein